MSREKHLTVEQFAERVGVPVKTVYDWNSKGLSPRYMPVGRYVRYRLVDVIAWEEARLTGGSQTA